MPISILTKWQKIRGITDAEAAQLYGVTRQTWIAWRSNPAALSLARYASICRALDIPHDEAAGELLQKLGGK